MPNADQSNNDRNFIDLPSTKAFDDTSRANSDNLGDACDPDDDNDGLTDIQEAGLGPGGTFHAACPSASAATDPQRNDTDGDGVVDGAECRVGSDPANVDSTPVAGIDSDGDRLSDALESALGSDQNSADTDGDGVLDGVEFLGYNTDPLSADTDGDGCSDPTEIGSVDNSSAVNAIDLQQIAQAFSANRSSPAYLLDFDVNKSGSVNAIDLQFAARNFGAC
jgi:hypothetical protein